ncbi:HNH endonuclease [Vibrio parahaemolyticus]|nr:HNH endonuclease [Vibrio parahaemolyticus]MDF4467027.1 HNH endonuclease [Vibrio parahaemolyticus]MDF4471687.1 HNH endonuclease [Vibrio parahaemolyticus]MDF4494958.1 HNH endonuclease [Vibrio parahaemolyticus]MDG2570626.1 HNH endonuclease [Vibrio parahaemolyticus]
MASNCALCGEEITQDNDTKEHIIPNAIGGRKKVTGFICNACNNKSGDTWENELAKQLNPLSLFFRISRERGNAPRQKFSMTDGNEIVLEHNGSMTLPKPQYRENIVDGQVQISIQARTIQEAKGMLKGVARKYPNADVDSFLDNAQVKSTYSPEMMEFNLSFGGTDAGRSIVKSALAVISDAKQPTIMCQNAIAYLTDQNAEACFGYYYVRDLIVNRPSGVPLHCVAVQGDQKTGLITFYAEYFGVQRVVGCLGQGYQGESFNHQYAIDPVSGTELDLDVELELSITEIIDAYDYKAIPSGSIENAIASIIPVQLELHSEQERARVIDSALRKALEEIGLKDGDQILPEHIGKLSSVVAEEVLPLMIHQLGLGKQ